MPVPGSIVKCTGAGNQSVLAALPNENLARHGLAFSVVSISGAIDEPKRRAMSNDQPTSFFIRPNDIAKATASLFDSEDQTMTGAGRLIDE